MLRKSNIRRNLFYEIFIFNNMKLTKNDLDYIKDLSKQEVNNIRKETSNSDQIVNNIEL